MDKLISMKPISGTGSPGLAGQIDLSSLPPAAKQARSLSPDDAVRNLAESVTKRNGAVPKTMKPSPSTQRSGTQANQKIPVTYVLSNTKPPVRTNVDDLDPAQVKRLNEVNVWAPVQGGKFGVRFNAEATSKNGKPTYDIGGGKTVITRPCESWVAAAKEAVRLSANGALAPRIGPSAYYESPRIASNPIPAR